MQPATSDPDIDGGHAWVRLAVSVLICALGGVGFWSIVVVLPTIQADFGIDRSSASLPYTATMLGFAVGGIMMGRLADRFGVVVPVLIGVAGLATGYVATALSQNVWQLCLAQGVLIGFFGASATFAPLVADVSHWFVRRRGIAVALVASGNYLAGAFWPPLIQGLTEATDWRRAHLVVAAICVATILPLALGLRRRSPVAAGSLPVSATGRHDPSDLSPRTIGILLVIAGFSCCVAMSMPQVHLVAYCADLGYGIARGAEMLSMMLGLGIVSRLASGWIADRVGGLPTLLIGSMLQCLALIFYLPFDGLVSLYVVSALFGLGQGGIVPSYAIIVREYFRPSEAGARVGVVLMATIVGMAFGGWMSGAIFDATGSYQMAFVNGIAWNLVNMSIALWLLVGPGRRTAEA